MSEIVLPGRSKYNVPLHGRNLGANYKDFISKETFDSLSTNEPDYVGDFFGSWEALLILGMCTTCLFCILMFTIFTRIRIWYNFGLNSIPHKFDFEDADLYGIVENGVIIWDCDVEDRRSSAVTLTSMELLNFDFSDDLHDANRQGKWPSENNHRRLSDNSLERKLSGDSLGRRVSSDSLGRRVFSESLGRRVSGDSLGRRQSGDSLERSLYDGSQGRRHSVNSLGRRLSDGSLKRKLSGNNLGRRSSGNSQGRKMSGNSIGRSSNGSYGRRLSGDSFRKLSVSSLERRLSDDSLGQMKSDVRLFSSNRVGRRSSNDSQDRRLSSDSLDEFQSVQKAEIQQNLVVAKRRISLENPKIRALSAITESHDESQNLESIATVRKTIVEQI